MADSTLEHPIEILPATRDFIEELRQTVDSLRRRDWLRRVGTDDEPMIEGL